MEQLSQRLVLSPVVCADVDGTIIRTDLLYESLLARLKDRPAALLMLPFWLLKGRAYLKQELSNNSSLDIQSIPLHEEVISYLKSQSERGRTIVLASASHKVLVEALATRLGFVDQVFATEGNENLKGQRKADLLVEWFGEKGFEYLGDSKADQHVWRHAEGIGVVAKPGAFQRDIVREFPNANVFIIPKPGIKTIICALRVYQWLKNLLVFVPLLMAHRWLDFQAVGAALAAGIAFSLCASGVYLINDLLDLESDRGHHRKRNRPCASGILPLQTAMALAPLLFGGGIFIGALVSWNFVCVLSLYLFLTTSYSFRLKQVALVDIIVLAMLYTIRIIAGGIAAHVVVSQWLLGVSMFTFLSLACVKRFSELLVLSKKNEQKTPGRGYVVEDMEQVAMFGAASGYIAVLVLALYVNSKEVVELYRNPRVIWLACPLMLYWVSRVWLLARRGFVHDDPLVFTMRDRATYIIGFLTLIIFAAAKW